MINLINITSSISSEFRLFIELEHLLSYFYLYLVLSRSAINNTRTYLFNDVKKLKSTYWYFPGGYFRRFTLGLRTPFITQTNASLHPNSTRNYLNKITITSLKSQLTRPSDDKKEQIFEVDETDPTLSESLTLTKMKMEKKEFIKSDRTLPLTVFLNPG